MMAYRRKRSVSQFLQHHRGTDATFECLVAMPQSVSPTTVIYNNGKFLRSIMHVRITITNFSDFHNGTIGFSQSNYTAVEGGETVLVCIVLLSQTGPLTGSALIGFSPFQGPLEGFRASGEVNFEGAMVGDPLLCQNLTIQDDDIPEPDQVALLSAFIEGPPSISYALGGDQATITVIDNDGRLVFEFS
jgi:hypothetical protein